MESQKSILIVGARPHHQAQQHTPYSNPSGISTQLSTSSPPASHLIQATSPYLRQAPCLPPSSLPPSSFSHTSMISNKPTTHQLIHIIPLCLHILLLLFPLQHG